ncbi:MAG: hypothetical protein PVF91_08085 [Chromatiales bacterium]
MAEQASVLGFTAVTSGGDAYDIAFPLHPETRSGQAVSDIVSAALDAISGTLEHHGDLSDGDILQGLAMTMAIRARMVDASAQTSRALMHDLVQSAFEAAGEARRYRAARA